jgi:predicted phage-related endonuclease
VTSLSTGLSDQDIEDRKHFIGGSDANIIMNGSAQDVAELIAIKRGERPPKNLNRVLPVRMGIRTEGLNIEWYTELLGRSVVGTNVRKHHFLYDWMAQTPDGLTTVENGSDAIFEAKHTSERNNMAKMVVRYYPQVQHAMTVFNFSWAVLSVFFGNGQWDYAEVPYDQDYCDNVLIPRLKLFWYCRQTGERWPELPPPSRPDIANVLKISKPRDMSRNNKWVHDATRYRELKPLVEEFLQVSDNLKALVDREVKIHSGAGVTATVSKTGSVTLKVDPDWNPIDDIAANDDDELTD